MRAKRWNERRRISVGYSSLTDAEKIARYIYLLDSLPPLVIEDAHWEVLARLPGPIRRRIGSGLHPVLDKSERSHAARPDILARAMRRTEEARFARAPGHEPSGSSE